MGRVNKVTQLAALLLALAYGDSYAQLVKSEFSKGTPQRIPETFHSISTSSFSERSPFWLKVTIVSESDKEAMLTGGNWYMQQVSFFNEAGKLIGTGNHFEVQLKKGENKFYLFYPFPDDKDSNGLTVSVIAIKDFNTEYFTMRTEQVVFTASVGMLFLLSAVYSIFIRSNDKIYIHYALYLFTIMVFFAYQYGILGNVFGIVNHIPPGWFWIFSDFITITYLYFSQSFLDMKKKDPLLHRVFNFGIYLVMAMAVIETVTYLIEIDILHSVWFKGPVFAFEIIIFPFIFYRIYKQKTILSWLFLASLIIVSVANMAGQVASTFKLVSTTNYFLQSATLIDAFIFSIGIAIRFGILAKDKQNIQSDLIRQLKVNEEIQELNAAELETKVMHRTEALDKRNHENELLIKEIHHRVKNNLQVITSLLNISERKIKDEAAKEPFRDSVNRINSMGLIHSYLYQNEDISDIDIRKYITQLSTMIIDTFRSKCPHVELQVETGSVKLDMDHAIEIGLIINELITNSLKHGVYTGNKPTLSITMTNDTDKLTLTVSDNGHVISGEKDTNSSFGLRMISALVKKMNGSVSIHHEKGFEVRIIMGLKKAMEEAPLANQV